MEKDSGLYITRKLFRGGPVRVGLTYTLILSFSSLKRSVMAMLALPRLLQDAQDLPDAVLHDRLPLVDTPPADPALARLAPEVPVHDGADDQLPDFDGHVQILIICMRA